MKDKITPDERQVGIPLFSVKAKAWIKAGGAAACAKVIHSTRLT